MAKNDYATKKDLKSLEDIHNVYYYFFLFISFQKYAMPKTRNVIKANQVRRPSNPQFDIMFP